MEKDAEDRKPGERSSKFPFISLEKALDRATKFYEHERRGSAPYPVAAQYWGYKASSSGAIQTFAALRSYGLLEGTPKNMRLSDLALRILMDNRSDFAERNQLKRQAALNPPIAAKIRQKWPDDLPSDETLNHFLVLELGLNESTASKTIGIIKENEQIIDSSHSAIPPLHDEIKKTPEMERQQLKDALRPQGLRGEEKRGAKGWEEHTHDPQGLDIVLQFGGEPTEETYQYLQDFFQFRLEQLKKSKLK